jgi:hypothetical protein
MRDGSMAVSPQDAGLALARGEAGRVGAYDHML